MNVNGVDAFQTSETLTPTALEQNGRDRSAFLPLARATAPEPGSSRAAERPRIHCTARPVQLARATREDGSILAHCG